MTTLMVAPLVISTVRVSPNDGLGALSEVDDYVALGWAYSLWSIPDRLTDHSWADVVLQRFLRAS